MQTLFNIVMGTVLACGGWFARQLWESVQRLKDDIHRVEVDLPKTYVPKNEFSSAMHRIEDLFQRISDKLDEKADKR